jgi:VCBS repeat-containing protein
VITTGSGIDTDIDVTPVPDTLTVTAVSGTAAGTVNGTTAGTYGVLTLHSDGSYSYALSNGTNGVASAVQNLAAGATVADTFTYTISDGHGGTSSSTLTITVTGTDDAPVAHADVNSVTEDTVLTATGNVITTGSGIDTDIDVTPIPDTLTVTAVSGAGAGVVGSVTHGTYGDLTLNSNGSYSYALNNGSSSVQQLGQGQTVADTFSYTISDGHGGTSSTTLTITVTGTADAVVANPDVNTVTEDTTLTASGNVITTGPGADTDSDPTAVLAVTAVSGTAAGTVNGTTAGTYGILTLNSNGSYSYALNNGANGVASAVQSLAAGATVADTFTYTVSDGHGGTASTTLTITVTGTDDAPVAHADVNSVTEDTVLTATGNVITTGSGADTDIDVTPVPDTLTVTAVSGTAAGTVNGTTAGTYGVLTLHTDGSYSYALNNGTNGVASAVQDLQAGATVADTFTYTISDGHGGTSSTTLTITVTGTNDAPVANPDVNSVTEDTTLIASGNVITTGSGADTDIDITPIADTLTVTAVTGGIVGGITHGTYGDLTLNSNGSYSYALDNGTNGVAGPVQSLAKGATVADTFTYTISDGHGGTASTTLTITVTGTDDAAVVTAGAVDTYTTGLTTTEILTITPGLTVTDIDSTTLASATVSIQGFHAGDILGFTHQTGITESYNSATGVLTLTGIASLATYQTELASITFNTTSADSSDRTIDYTVNDGFLDSALATSLIHIEPLLNIHGTLTTNSNSSDQTALLTVTDEANPAHSFQTLIFLSAQGQQGTFADHANFSIGSGHNFLISLEWISGTKVDVTDFTLDGVTIINQVQHASLGDGTGGSNDALVAEINPFTSLVSGFTLSTDGGTGNNTITGTATPSAQYLYGGGGAGNDTLTGLDGVHNILNGGAGGTDILTGGNLTDILVWNGGNTLGAALSAYAGGGGTDILRIDNPAGAGPTGITVDTDPLITSGRMTGIEVFDITGASGALLSSATPALPGGVTSGNTILLSAADILTETNGGGTITILGDSNDTVNLTAGFTGATPTPLSTDPTHFSVYQSTAIPTVAVIIANTIDPANVHIS